MHLSNAYICQDCESIDMSPHQCQSCTSFAVYSLAAWLNRESTEPQLTIGKHKILLGGPVRLGTDLSVTERGSFEVISRFTY